MRTRRSDPSGPGYRRIAHGRGFRYLDQHGQPLPSAEVDRIKALVIPPAWRNVWICADPAGHIQAVGTDAAGRRQYLYHDAWRANRDRQKFDHVLTMAEALPRLRRQVRRHLHEAGLTRRRVLATAVSLLDLARLRVGGDEYAAGEDATFGTATLRADHVRIRGGSAVLCFPAKGGIQLATTVTDEDVVAVLAALRRVRRGTQRLLIWRDDGGIHEVHAADINAYLRDMTGLDITAKDFRTLHATVLAAAALAREGIERSRTGRRRRVAKVLREVAEELGNTPAVARASYVDPRVVDRYESGVAIERPDAPPSVVERQVVRLLRS
jgi:DNA topoisomerase-1